MEEDKASPEEQENRYLGAVQQSFSPLSWLPIIGLMFGLFGLVLHFTASTLEQLTDKDTDRLIAQLYEPWKLQSEKSFGALRTADRELNEGKSDKAKFISRVNSEVRPGLVKALEISEQFVPKTKTIEKVKNHFVTDSRRALRFVDDMIDGVTRDDRESLIRTNKSFAEYAASAPQRWQELMRSCGMDQPLPSAGPN